MISLTIMNEDWPEADNVLSRWSSSGDMFLGARHQSLLARALLKEKQAGMVPKKSPVAASEPRVVNLMEALRRSISAEESKKPAAKAAPTRRRKRA
jgi:non-homologous end joining protein Ku